jgi:Ni2+-binding GTPase involved in maturation of urease and hydrogenase
LGFLGDRTFPFWATYGRLENWRFFVMVVKAQEFMYGAFGGSKYLLGGPTCAGKTTFISKLVNPKATSLISQMVGKGNCTLKSKVFVLSEDKELEHSIRLCAKPNRQAMNRKDYDDVIIETFGNLAKQTAKEIIKYVETADQLLRRRFIKGDNHVSFLGLLKAQADEWIVETAAIIEKVEREELRSLYDVARARIEDPEFAKAKTKSSVSLDIKLSEVFRDYLDGSLPTFSGNDIGRLLAEQYNKINELFFDLATQFFSGSKVTRDKYFTLNFPLNVDLDDELNKKKNAFFSDNSSADKISMEVLYEEIVIYVGINLGLVKQLGPHADKFKNRNGIIEFGLIDTMGAFHRYGDKNEARNYFANLTREHEFDGVILLIPLNLEANEKKFVQLSSDFFRQFPFDLDVVIISNKADRVIDQFKKEWKSKYISNDPFSDIEESDEIIDVDSNMLKEHLVNAIKTIEQEFVENTQEQGNGRVHLLAHLATSFVENKFDTLGLNQLKNLSQTVVEMMRHFSESKTSIEKISIEFDADYGSDIGIDINKSALNQGVSKILKHNMFENVEKNCRENKGKVPHGQSFNALPSRLSYGEGYKVELHERFWRVESFEITFPGTIRNSLKSIEHDLVSVLQDCITFEGVRNLTSDIKESLLERLASHLVVRNITAYLVYTRTFRPVMTQPYYSFGAKFQAYIKNVMESLTKPDYCDFYTASIENEVRRAFKSMLDTDVVYRK